MLSTWEDEIKAPLCTISRCVNPITFKFECHCSLVAESFKAIPESGTAAAAIGFSQQFVDDTLACCPGVGTSDTKFLKCMIGCDDEISSNTLCMFVSCDVAQVFGFTDETVQAVTTSCCPNGEPIKTFNTCFESMGDNGLIDKEKWRSLESVNADQIDIFCNDVSGIDQLVNKISAGSHVRSVQLSAMIMFSTFLAWHLL